MQTAEKYTKKNRGRTFKFRLKKLIELPVDAEKRYVIEDDAGAKYTLSYNQYKHYSFQQGDEIQCRLDHINCSGEVFFEPQNPRYKRGEAYHFKVLKKELILNYLNLEEEVLVVEDSFGKEHWVRYAKGAKVVNNEVRAYVEKIKKGRLYLIPAYDTEDGIAMESLIPFEIVEQNSNDRLGACFVAKDKWGNLHALPMSYYINYGLNIGSKFTGRLTKLSSKGFFYLEPKHPVYTYNESYSFTVFETINTAKGITAFVLDCYDNPVKVVSAQELKIGEQIKCKVVSIVKGKPQLEMLS